MPLVIAISTALAARAGILVKDRLALERMRQVDVVLFDKTGTLTTGHPAVTGVVAVNGQPDEILRLAAAVESDSEHPLAKAVVAAREKGSVPTARNFRSMTGRGVEADVDGRRLAVSGPALLRERSLAEPEATQGETNLWKKRGATVLYLIDGGGVLGTLALGDEIRPESKQAVKTL